MSVKAIKPLNFNSSVGSVFKSPQGWASLPTELVYRIIFQCGSSKDIKALSGSHPRYYQIITGFEEDKVSLDACQIFVKTLGSKLNIIDVRSSTAICNGAVTVSKLALFECIIDIQPHLEKKDAGYTLMIIRSNVVLKDQLESTAKNKNITVREPEDFSLFGSLSKTVNKTACVVLIANDHLKETDDTVFGKQEIFLDSLGCRMAKIQEMVPYCDFGIANSENKPCLFERVSPILINVSDQYYGSSNYAFPLTLSFNAANKTLTGNLTRNYAVLPNTIAVKELNPKHFFVKPW